MSNNKDKKICCRVDNVLLNQLNAIANHKELKLSAYLRSVLQGAAAAELMQLENMQGNQ